MATKRTLHLEEPGSAPSAAPAAPGVDDSDPATLLEDLNTPTIVEVVSPPLIQESTAGLPDAADVDPSKIKTNTLTKQGWVLPTAAQAQAAW